MKRNMTNQTYNGAIWTLHCVFKSVILLEGSNQWLPGHQLTIIQKFHLGSLKIKMEKNTSVLGQWFWLQTFILTCFSRPHTPSHFNVCVPGLNQTSDRQAETVQTTESHFTGFCTRIHTWGLYKGSFRKEIPCLLQTTAILSLFHWSLV